MLASSTMNEEVFAEGFHELKETSMKALSTFRDYVETLEISLCDPERTKEVFRIIHNLKALAMWFNLQETHGMFKRIEEVLYKIKEDAIIIQESMFPWFSEALEQLEHFYHHLEGGKSYAELSMLSYSLRKLQEQDLTANPIHLQNLRILYIEDDPSIQNSLARFLKRRVKELILASDGLDGLHKFEQFAPDMIIADINMPNLHGLKLAEEVLRRSPTTPIIITSAHNEAPFKYQASLLGITSYLVKPFAFQDLELELIYSLI